MIRTGKAGGDSNVWGLAHADFHKTLLGGHEKILIEKNGNNPPTIKAGSRFSVYLEDATYLIPDTPTGNNAYPQNTTPTYMCAHGIIEASDLTFTWNSTARGETIPLASDGTWYACCSGAYDLSAATKGQGAYNFSKTETPTHYDSKGGWYSAAGYRILAKFTVASSVVSNIEIYQPKLNRYNFFYTTDDYTATINDEIIIVNGTDKTVTLPAASTATGLVLYLKNINATTTLTVDANASETIDGDTSISIPINNCAQLICDGVQWWII